MNLSIISDMGYTWLYPPKEGVLPLMLLERIEVGLLKRLVNTLFGIPESAENIHADIFSLFPKPSTAGRFPKVSAAKKSSEFKGQDVLDNKAGFDIDLLEGLLPEGKAQIKSELKDAKKLIYDFKSPTWRHIDTPILLEEYLNLTPPSTHAYGFVEKLQSGKIFVITEILQTNSFTVRDASGFTLEGKVDAKALEDYLGALEAHAKVGGNSSVKLSYKGEEPITFGLRASKILYDKETKRYSLSRRPLENVRSLDGFDNEGLESEVIRLI